MICRTFLTLCILLMGFGLCVAATPYAGAGAGSSMMAATDRQAVTIYLRDGREFTGRLLEEHPHRIRIETVLSGIKIEMTFGADEVRSLERHIDVPQVREAPPVGGGDAEATATGDGGWVVVPAHGMIGQELTKNFFETCVNQAVTAGAEAIVFDLKSPGGYLYSLEEIYQALQAQTDRIKIVFFVNDACFSAAALLCITSDAFFVGPGASFGSAVVIHDNGRGGVDAVNAKFASAQAAVWRTRAERKGRPGILVNAMMLVETEVWADKSSTPWNLFASRPEGRGTEVVVNDRSILSMTATEAVGLGAADATRRDVAHVISELGLRNPDREAYNGSNQASRIIRAQQRRLHDLENRLNFIDSVIDRIGEGIKDRTLTVDEFRRDLIRVRSGLDRIRREMDQTDYIRFQCLIRGVTYEVLDEWRRLIDDALRQLR
ncbi:MAG: hypothetical protein ACNA8P_08675 [Phycisphaerales bacterium]